MPHGSVPLAHVKSPPWQIWFYTTIIFENAGIPVSQIPYTTVGTGAIEVVMGLIGVSDGWTDGRSPLSARALSPTPSIIKRRVLDGPQMPSMPQHSPFAGGQRV